MISAHETFKLWLYEGPPTTFDRQLCVIDMFSREQKVLLIAFGDEQVRPDFKQIEDVQISDLQDLYNLRSPRPSKQYLELKFAGALELILTLQFVNRSTQAEVFLCEIQKFAPRLVLSGSLEVLQSAQAEIQNFIAAQICRDPAASKVFSCEMTYLQAGKRD